MILALVDLGTLGDVLPLMGKPVSILHKAYSWSQFSMKLVNLPRCKAVSKASSKLGRSLRADRRVTGEVKENNHVYDYENISLIHR